MYNSCSPAQTNSNQTFFQLFFQIEALQQRLQVFSLKLFFLSKPIGSDHLYTDLRWGETGCSWKLESLPESLP